MNNKTLLYDFLRQNKYMAFATVSADGKPEVATVEYLIDGDDLIINTFVHYRKYQNLAGNDRVAGVVTTGHERTLQFDGTATELSGENAAYARQKLMEVDPDFANFFDDERTRFFRIKPTWMRLRDYTVEPMRVIELEEEGLR